METFRWIFYTYITINLIIIRIHGSTPLCELCPCNSEPNSPPNINCVNSGISNIYERKYWFDDSNTSYPIASLILKNNNLKELKTQFPVSNLQMLDLSKNFIKEISYSVFSQLQNMSELILGYNEIERIDPDIFRGVYEKDEYFPLKSLKSLDLQHNKLHTLDGDTFEHIDELEELNLSNNPFKVIDVQTLTAIAGLVRLRILNLSQTQIKTLPNYFMHTPKYLTVLDLSGNNFVTIPETLSESHSLEVLYLDNNPIQNLSGSNIFPKIPTLKVLHMSNMPLLKEIDAKALSGLERLEKLYLSDNRVLARIHPEAFLLETDADQEKRIPLIEVHMKDNSISYLDHTTLQWNQLQQLDLRGNPWACECENQWLLDELIPAYVKIDEAQAQELRCYHPVEMKGLTLFELYQKKSLMRCLDLYVDRPEGDTFILIGILSGALTGVVVTMLGIYVYRSKQLHLGPNSGSPKYVRV